MTAPFVLARVNALRATDKYVDSIYQWQTTIFNIKNIIILNAENIALHIKTNFTILNTLKCFEDKFIQSMTESIIKMYDDYFNSYIYLFKYKEKYAINNINNSMLILFKAYKKITNIELTLFKKSEEKAEQYSEKISEQISIIDEKLYKAEIDAEYTINKYCIFRIIPECHRQELYHVTNIVKILKNELYEQQSIHDIALKLLMNASEAVIDAETRHIIICYKLDNITKLYLY